MIQGLARRHFLIRSTRASHRLRDPVRFVISFDRASLSIRASHLRVNCRFRPAGKPDQFRRIIAPQFAKTVLAGTQLAAWRQSRLARAMACRCDLQPRKVSPDGTPEGDRRVEGYRRERAAGTREGCRIIVDVQQGRAETIVFICRKQAKGHA
jgi:hypothetical protein